MTRSGPCQIDAWLAQVRDASYRLVLLADRALAHGGGTDLPENWPGCATLNVNLALSQRLLDLPSNQRPAQAPIILADLLAGNGPVILYDVELLFDPTLQLEPLRALKAASRSRSVVVLWPGTLENGVLTYAEPGHPEYRRYEPADLVEIFVVSVAEPTMEA